jgi:hypothetical protein
LGKFNLMVKQIDSLLHQHRSRYSVEEESILSTHIAAECARIRAGWSELEHRRRACGWTREEVREQLAWRPPTLPISEDAIL